MPEKRYGKHVPEPARFAALKGDWDISQHDNWPDHYELCGSIPGGGGWERVEPENEAHMILRAAAMQRVPQMLVQLQEAYDLLLDMDDRGEIDGPEWTSENGRPDRTGRRLGELMQCIGMTLSEIEQRGVGLGPGTPRDEQTTGRKEEANGE